MHCFAVIGLGYVGLRVATALAEKHHQVIGFDISQTRIKELQQHHDHNEDVLDSRLAKVNIQFTSDPKALDKANFYFVDIDTPVNAQHLPDMSSLKAACVTVGKHLKQNDIVVFESTIYPGTTEEVLIPILEEQSGLKAGENFFVGYSPERIVPGDAAHDLGNTPKIISAQDPATLAKIKAVYSTIVHAPLALAASIKVAEAAKLLENIQRDVNIALMNEFAIIADKLNISIYDIIEVAKTKWNFLPFTPGLVGGHCTPVDPYYLIYKAEQLGYDLPLITTTRKVNDSMVDFIAQTIEAHSGANESILLMGLSFKANITDIRSSLSLVLYKQLLEQHKQVTIYDPIAYTKNLSNLTVAMDWDKLASVDVIVITVAHEQFAQLGYDNIIKKIKTGGMLIDIPGMFRKLANKNPEITYRSL